MLICGSHRYQNNPMWVFLFLLNSVKVRDLEKHPIFLNDYWTRSLKFGLFCLHLGINFVLNSSRFKICIFQEFSQE